MLGGLFRTTGGRGRSRASTCRPSAKPRMEEAVAATVVDLDRHRLDGARAAALRNDTASQANCCWAIGFVVAVHTYAVVAPVAAGLLSLFRDRD